MMIYALVLLLMGQGGDGTVLATAERLFHNGSCEMAAEMISVHSWSSDSLWSRAGIILELCSGEFSIVPGQFNSPFDCSFAGEYSAQVRWAAPAADSVRLFIPVPVMLPWQNVTESEEVILGGIDGSYEINNGWLKVEGVSLDTVTVSFSSSVETGFEFFSGPEVPGVEDAMVFFPGEEPFMDICMDTDTYWAGGDRVYMESVSLARGEPNPMRLAARLRTEVSRFFNSSEPVTGEIHLESPATLALNGSLNNSVGGAVLGASILRHWQVPAIPSPGRFAGGAEFGYALFFHVKPFGWMALSPVPADFVFTGSPEHPPVSSWPSGVPGVSVYGEYLSTEGRWYAVPCADESLFLEVTVIPR